jgi:hypothetical protein
MFSFGFGRTGREWGGQASDGQDPCEGSASSYEVTPSSSFVQGLVVVSAGEGRQVLRRTPEGSGNLRVRPDPADTTTNRSMLGNLTGGSSLETSDPGSTPTRRGGAEVPVRGL